MGERTGDDRGVSPVIGVVLVLVISTMVIGATAYYGNQALSDYRGNIQGEMAVNEMSQLDSKAALVALGQTRTQHVPVSGQGDISVDPDAGRVVITRANETTEYEIVNESYGAVVERTPDGIIAYQGGGVWRKQGDRSVMVSPPEFHYRGQTLTFPIIKTEGSDGPVSNTIRIRKNGSKRLFNQTRYTDGHIQIRVTSAYHYAWASYFEQRTEGGVTHDVAHRTVTVNLSVPFTETFEYALAATDSGSDAITSSKNGGFDAPKERGVNRPSASPIVDEKIDSCVGGNCTTLSSALVDGSLENGTYFEDGSATIDSTTYDTNGGDIHVVVDGDLTFEGGGGPHTLNHEVTGDGTVWFYVKGDMEISGNTKVNTGGNPSSIVLLQHSNGGSVSTASGTPQFTGLIYAPNATLTLNGGGAVDDNIVGAAVVKNARANGHASLGYSPPLVEIGQFNSTTQVTNVQGSLNRIEVAAPGSSAASGGTPAPPPRPPTTTITTTSPTTSTVVTTTEDTDDPPVPDIEDVSDHSCESYKLNADKCTNKNKDKYGEHAEFEVTWKASDDTGLSDVTVLLKDEDGSEVVTKNPSVSGSTATGTTILETTGAHVFGETYTIVVRATDSSSQTATVEEDYGAGG